MDLKTIPNISEKDLVMCKVSAVLGVSHDCSRAVEYAENGETATFTCSGTTLDYSCDLVWYWFMIDLI